MKWQMSNIVGVETETNNCREKRSNSTWHLSALLLCWSYVLHSFSYLSLLSELTLKWLNFLVIGSENVRFLCEGMLGLVVLTSNLLCCSIDVCLATKSRVLASVWWKNLIFVCFCTLSRRKEKIVRFERHKRVRRGRNHLNQLDTHTQC